MKIETRNTQFLAGTLGRAVLVAGFALVPNAQSDQDSHSTAEKRLIVYGALWWLIFHVAVVGYEEPTLEQTFGREYEAFRAAVPRWIPRMTPWRSE